MNITIKKLTWATLSTALPAVFLVLTAFGQFSPSFGGIFIARGAIQSVFGGPGGASQPREADASLAAKDSLALLVAPADEPDEAALKTPVAALALEATPLGNFVTRDGLTVYRAARGETLQKVAQNFGVSLNTLLWANPALRGRALRAGDEIIILPVSGVLHRALEGETLDVIALLYGIPEEELIAANPRLMNGPLTAQEPVIIPGGKPRRVTIPENSLPSIPGYFAIPAAGWNWGELHVKNAIDISNACGTPVLASAEGLVVETGNPEDWNTGYGGYIELEHPNGTGSKYAHLSKIDVTVGTYVEKRDKIGEIGNTGNVIGVTGCHLHFEVRGARNPFAK